MTEALWLDLDRLNRLSHRPGLLLTTTGLVAEISSECARLLRLEDPAAMVGQPLSALCDPAHDPGDYLLRCARTSEPIPSHLVLRDATPNGRRFRCWACRVPADRPRILLLLDPEDDLEKRFSRLSARIKESDRELLRRREAERREKQAREHLELLLSERIREEQERRRFEESRNEAMKLESLGVLAGGVAHDFNNILQTILGNVELARLKSETGEDQHRHFDAIETSSKRAAELCDQMLAFAGQGRVHAREDVDLSSLVTGMKDLLHATLDKAVVLETRLGADLPPVHGDPVQFRQLLSYLALNASDAIREAQDHHAGRSLRIETSLVSHEQLPSEGLLPDRPPAVAEHYVVIRFVDDGPGMEDATLRKVFEPFFSTRFAGRGLGLPAALGIARAHGGAMSITSESGAGTIVSAYLPAAIRGSTAAGHRQTAAPRAVAQHQPLVLAADDEPALRDYLGNALQRFGYRSLLAEDGGRALELFERNADDVDVVLLDLSMPVLDGLRVARRLLESSTRATIVLSSGYHDQNDERLELERSGVLFLGKPYRMEELRQVLETALSARRAPPDDGAGSMGDRTSGRDGPGVN